VARALVPAGVPPGPGTLADASFDTVSQPRTRVEMPGTGPQTGSLDTAGRVPAPHRLAECEKVGLASSAAGPSSEKTAGRRILEAVAARVGTALAGPTRREGERRRSARAAGQGALPVHRSLVGRGVSGRLLAPET
jgi:hypothetical protein